MRAAFEADFDVVGGEAQLAEAVGEVAADRVGGLVVVGGVQAFCECSVGEVGENRERDVEVDGERDLGAERVEVNARICSARWFSMPQRCT